MYFRSEWPRSIPYFRPKVAQRVLIQFLLIEHLFLSVESNPDIIGLALLHSVTGQETSRHPLGQSGAKLKPISTWLLAFSRA